MKRALTSPLILSTVAKLISQKIADENGKIVTHLERKTVFAVKTPQVFEFVPLFEAHAKAEKDGKIYTRK